MSCGLGAVILMFLLVKKNSQDEIKEIVNDKSNKEIELLEKEMDNLIFENNKLKKIKMSLTKEEKDLKININDYESILNLQIEKEKNNKSKIKELEKKIKKNDKKEPNTINVQGAGQQEYLIGLEIKGKKIAILLDSSASMTDEKLIDIIKRKTQLEKNIIKGPKWQRTLRIVKWLLVRLPSDSKVTIINFSKNSEVLGNNTWYKNNSKDLSLLLSEINKIVPRGATNLYSAFQSIEKLEPKPDEIFLITDGLPTKGSNSFSNQAFFSKCNSIIANAKKISGNCREKLFLTSINEARNIISSIKINVVLLPLEGDPQASNNFWKLASKNGGLLFVPSKDWP